MHDLTLCAVRSLLLRLDLAVRQRITTASFVHTLRTSAGQLSISAHCLRLSGHFPVPVPCVVHTGKLAFFLTYWSSPPRPQMFLLGRYGFAYYGYGCLFGTSFIARNSNAIFSSTFLLPLMLISLHFVYRYLSLERYCYESQTYTVPYSNMSWTNTKLFFVDFQASIREGALS